MKKVHLAILAGILSALAITTNTGAQSNDMATVFQNKVGNNNNKPRSENTNLLKRDLVSARALKHFEKNYKTSEEIWSNLNEGVMAGFTCHDGRYTIFYNKKGRWNGSIKTYQENLLAKDIRTMVKRQYFDFDIHVIHEIESLNSRVNPIYIVTITNKNKVKWIRVNNGNMDLYKDF